VCIPQSPTATPSPIALLRPQLRQISVTMRTQLIEHIKKYSIRCANSGTA
jgi:hypothetical protein